MTPLLVVVDMQPRFRSSQQWPVMRGVLREVRRQIKQNGPIIVLEYDSDPDAWTSTEIVTDHRILSLLAGYPHWEKAIKHTDDGSNEVLEIAIRRNWLRDRIRVCGVNWIYCVCDTVAGLNHQINKEPTTTGEDPQYLDYDFPKAKIEAVWDASNPRTTMNDTIVPNTDNVCNVKAGRYRPRRDYTGQIIPETPYASIA